MSAAAWVILLIFVVPLVVLAVWLGLRNSFVRIPTGKLGLLLVGGRPTDTALLPGPHFVFALRRRMVAQYPSLELAYRAELPADGAAEPDPPLVPTEDLQRLGPAVRLFLGDRTAAVVSYVVRFRLIPEHLRGIHDRFGPDGLFGIVRDESTRAVTHGMGEASVAVDDLFGTARADCEETLATRVADALRPAGIEVTAFVLGAVDLGRTGEVIQATARSRLELEREHAEAPTRLTRAINDAQLRPHTDGVAAGAWRYRELELVRDLARHSSLQVTWHGAAPGPSGIGLPTATPVDQLRT